MNAFEKAMGSIAKSFQKVDERFDSFEKSIKRITTTLETIAFEIGDIKHDNKEYRRRAAENEVTLISHDKKIDNILARVEKLEVKVR